MSLAKNVLVLQSCVVFIFYLCIQVFWVDGVKQTFLGRNFSGRKCVLVCILTMVFFNSPSKFFKCKEILPKVVMKWKIIISEILNLH